MYLLWFYYLSFSQGKLSTEDIELWGHEYVRHLAGEVVQEFNSLTENEGEFMSMSPVYVYLTNQQCSRR